MLAYQQRTLDLIAWANTLRDAGGWAKQTQASPQNPVSQAMNPTGTGRRFDVGPGKAIPTPDTVPWATLQPGDVVNIWPNTGNAPWLYRWGLSVKATAANPCIINGVTDAQGNRPIFDMRNSVAAHGCTPGGGNNLWSDTQYSLDGYGAVTINRNIGDDYYSQKPSFIQFRNLEITGGAYHTHFTDHLGHAVTVQDTCSGIWAQVVDDLRIINCVLHGNNFNLFSMAKDGILSQACEHIYLIGCRFYDGGNNNPDRLDRDHSGYMQCAYPAVFGCYFGANIAASQGSTYKDRSAGLVFFDNDVVTSGGRCLDFVQSEEQKQDGIMTLPGYGTDYVFNNSVQRHDCKNAFHYGGDNGEEDDGAGPPGTWPADSIARHNLYYWNNSENANSPQSENWRTPIFDLSWVTVVVNEWGNQWNLVGDTIWCWIEYDGTVHCHSTPPTVPVIDFYDSAAGHHNITHDTHPLTPPTGDTFLDALIAISGGGVVTPPGNQAPTASFGYVATGLSVAFNDTSSDPDGTIASRAWTFGDGGTSTETNPAHVYAAAGSYTVALTVTDNQGAPNSVSHPVTVTAVQPPPTTVITVAQGAVSHDIADDGVQIVLKIVNDQKAKTKHWRVKHGSDANIDFPNAAPLTITRH